MRGAGTVRASAWARLSRAAYPCAFALLLALAAALALAYRYPPLVDWPEHVAQDAIVRHLGDPAYGLARYYRTTGWFLPYQGFRWLHIALASVLGDDLGGRAALLGYLAGTPLAAAALVARIGRDRWVALGTFAVLVEANFLWGFAPYALGTTLVLAGLALAIDAMDRGGRARVAALAALGVALFFTHAQQTALLCVTAFVLAAVALARGATTRARAAWVIAALAPAGCCLAAYLLAHGWLDGTALRDRFAIVGPTIFRTPRETVALFPLSAGLTALGRLPWRAYHAALAAVALAAVIARSARRAGERDEGDEGGVGGAPGREASRGARWGFAGPVLAALWFALVFALPAEYRAQTISPRLASAALLALLWAPPWRPVKGARARWALAPSRAVLVAAGLAALVHAHARFARFDRATRPLDAVIAAVPRGSRVATLVFAPRAEGYALPVNLHLGGYVVAARGGVASAGFTRTGVSYTDAMPPGVLLVTEMWTPVNRGFVMDLAAYGPWYDYVFVQRGPRYPGSPFASDAVAGFRAARVLREGDLELWRISRTP